MASPGAATAPLPGLEPDLERARELARDANVVPVRYRFVDDCETPVSAFLKLRGDGPAFLLESAEQGRLGRWSFLGFRPRSILRWSEGTLSEWEGGGGGEPDRTSDARDPYAAAAEYLARYEIAEPDELPPFAGGAVGFFGYDLVRTVEPLAEPNPDPIGLPDMALMISDVLLAFDHQRHEVTVIANAFVEDGGIEAAYGRAVETIAEVRERLREPVPLVGGGAGGGAAVRVEPDPGGVRGDRRPDHRVRPRRRRLPGRALAALQRPLAGGGVLDLSRPPHGQSLALHVLPRLRRLRDRGRLTRAAGEGERPPGRDPADRRHLPARR